MSIKSEELDFLRSGINLGLLAKNIVNGFLIGQHKGTRRGIGSEFSQYRSYQPGDDIRQIDWKMYVRSDRYYIKEAETETSVTIRIFIDASASMNYVENGVSRWNYAALISAALGTLAVQQGDAIALHVVNEETQLNLKEKRGKAHLNRLFQLLESVHCKGKWPESMDWLPDVLSSHQRELWVVCSDMLDGVERWKTFVKMSEALGHEVQFLQILGKNELHLDLADNATVQDPESQQRLNIQTKVIRERYLSNLNAYLKELKDALVSRTSNIHLMTMDESIQNALFRFLKLRERL